MQPKDKPLLAGVSKLEQRVPLYVDIAQGGQLIRLVKEPEKRGYWHAESGRWIVCVPGGQVGTKKTLRDFSVKSRINLIRTVASIDLRNLPLPIMCSVTYAGDDWGDWHKWKEDQHRFLAAIHWRWPDCWGLWRLEFQLRGAPHFHFLLWCGPHLNVIEAWSDTEHKTVWVPYGGDAHNLEIYNWMEKTWGLGITNTIQVGSINGVFAYASKYLAKLPDGNYLPEGQKGFGRFWGRFNHKKWPIDIVRSPVTDRTFFRIKRILRKVAQARIRVKRRILARLAAKRFKTFEALRFESKLRAEIKTWKKVEKTKRRQRKKYRKDHPGESLMPNRRDGASRILSYELCMGLLNWAMEGEPIPDGGELQGVPF